MAAEAVIIELLGTPAGHPIRYIISDATGIEKGTLMVVTDPRTVVAHSTGTTAFVGILAVEKVASDGQVSVPLYNYGIFDLTAAAAGAATVGYNVALSGTANMTSINTAAIWLTGGMVGRVLETQSNDEVSAVLVNIN